MTNRKEPQNRKIFILIVYLFRILNPMMILIIPVVYFTYSEGYISGSLSGSTAIAYSAYFFFKATADQAAAEKLVTIILALLAVVLLVGRLKARDNRSYIQLRRIVNINQVRFEQKKQEFTVTMDPDVPAS